MAFTIDVKCALIFVVAIPLLSVVVFGIILSTIPMYKKVQSRLDQVLGITRENLTGVRVIRAFHQEEKEEELVCYRDITIDPDLQTVQAAGEKIALTEMEYQILLLLISHPRKVFSVKEIYELVWKEEFLSNSGNTVMVHIRNIRRKLEKKGESYIWKNRLTLELLGMCAAALLIAIAAANLAQNIAVDWIYNVVYSDEKYEQDITDMLQSLQDYVQEEQVTEDNIKQLVNWVRKQKNVYVTFYRDIDELLGPFMANSGDEPYEVDAEYESMYYTVNLYDGTPIKVQLEVYLDMNYMYWADVAMYVTGGIVFLLLLLLMIHHKIRYINRLESELKILGGGNLEYPITRNYGTEKWIFGRAADEGGGGEGQYGAGDSHVSRSEDTVDFADRLSGAP